MISSFIINNSTDRDTAMSIGSNSYEGTISMCIYCGTDKYRKIYESHFGTIPVDQLGRSYDIHHIDGNRKNNSPNNLKAVSIQEHFDIHYSQKEYGAALRISARLAMTAEERSNIATEENRRRVKNGTHHFLDREKARERELRKVANGTHSLLGGDITRAANARRIAEGTHNFQDSDAARARVMRQINAGTHNFVTNNPGPAATKRSIENGTHNSFSKLTCPWCNKTGSLPNMKRWHFDNCKKKDNDSE